MLYCTRLALDKYLIWVHNRALGIAGVMLAILNGVTPFRRQHNENAG